MDSSGPCRIILVKNVKTYIARCLVLSVIGELAAYIMRPIVSLLRLRQGLLSQRMTCLASVALLTALLAPAATIFGFSPVWAILTPTLACFAIGFVLLRRAG